MKIIVLGAGVIGVTSAWYLSAAGHEVTVIERRDAAGLETSLRQRRPDLRRPCRALGQARRCCRRFCAGWDARTRRCCSVRAPTRRSGSGALRFLLECLPGRFERHSRTLAGLAGLQPRMPARLCARSSASATTISNAASCISPPTSAISRRWRAMPKQMRALGMRRQVKSAARMLRARAGAAGLARSGARRRLQPE